MGQVQGKYYDIIDPYGEGTKWAEKRSIHHSLLLVFAQQDDGKTMSFGAASFSGIDSSYR
ncbi:hypothetical protein IGI04_041474 [Brassica rapa subsp. trilocularis]|uniref:Jacalin-type lectin domain-containing protein n=1 Tax=Brassica rapa subsp. trilocularis TaxID=1813537 RepID=A0ABQ7KRK4_BRACM|nr:hypothetical protein IGI04_041474 [Brassica rapa subsp. trilocularis]